MEMLLSMWIVMLTTARAWYIITSGTMVLGEKQYR